MTTDTVIACEVFRAELEHLRDTLDLPVRLEFLEQMLHDRPDTLRDELQAAIDRAEEAAPSPRRLLLGYGLCGRGLTGVSSRKATLVIPRVHDCIPLLLGVDQDASGELSQSGGTYWFSPGWLGCSQVAFIRERDKRRAAYEEQYGPDNADYLMDLEGGWLQNYTGACLIRWKAFGDAWVKDARAVAEDAGLPYREQEGSDNYLRALLEGGGDLRRFLHVPPGKTIDVIGDGSVDIVPALRAERA